MVCFTPFLSYILNAILYLNLFKPRMLKQEDKYKQMNIFYNSYTFLWTVPKFWPD